MKRPSSNSAVSNPSNTPRLPPIQIKDFENEHASLNNAKTTFLNRVLDGISYLVHQNGYSQSRATNLILDELRKDDPLPSDDEVSVYAIFEFDFFGQSTQVKLEHELMVL